MLRVMNNNRIHIVIGVISILIGVYRLIDSVYLYLYGPPIFDTSILMLIPFSRYSYFIQEWICMGTLLIAGINMLIKKQIAYYCYNFFFIAFPIYYVPRVIEGLNFAFDDILYSFLLIMSILGLFYVIKKKPETEFHVRKAINFNGYLLLIFLFFALIVMPILFE